jgi:hypothetical protein
MEEVPEMLKTLMIPAAVSGLMIAGTLAQSAEGVGNSPKFVAMQNPDQWVFSKFKGTNVIGPNDETIGTVSDLMFDRSGKILGVVVGVGGFLGIGTKNVAMDMSAFEVIAPPTTTTKPLPGPVADHLTDPTNVRLKVAWTKDQLRQAPDFQYYRPPIESASGDSRPSTLGMGLRRKPALDGEQEETRGR